MNGDVVVTPPAAREMSDEDYEREHDQLIDAERTMLADNIERARFSLLAALMSVKRLASNEVYDVEYAEGNGHFVEKFLLDAQLAIAGAQSITKGIAG